MIAFSKYTKNPDQLKAKSELVSHTTPLMARTQPSTRSENVVAVCALPTHTTPRTTSRMPNVRNQPQDLRTCSRPAARKSETVVIFILLSVVGHRVASAARFNLSQRMNDSGAFLGAEKGVDAFGSELNLPKTAGSFCMCCCNESTR